jgi:hypothetical protein
VIRNALIGLAILWALTGIYVFFSPMAFYEMTPGLKLMGPFNMHFIRDVGLAFIASGGILGWGCYTGARSLAYAGIAWPVLHAGFHLQIWGHRGFPFDHIFAFDMVAVILPPLLALLGVRRLAGASQGETQR